MDLEYNLQIKLLPALYIIKNFVKGEKDCDYEKYLLELINESRYFEGVFHSPKTENFGECDAISNNYQIDFKLLASKTALQASSLFSPQIYTLSDGVTSYCRCKKEDGNITATRIFAALRGKKYDELCKIRNNATKIGGVENDIMTMLKMFEKEKNILFFFPYILYFEEQCKEDTAIRIIQKALEHDFASAFEYRNKYVNKKYDTFITCIYDKDIFLIYKEQGQKLRLVDRIKTSRLPTFMKLKRYEPWN